MKSFIKTINSLYLVDLDEVGLRKMCYVNFNEELPVKDGYFGKVNFCFDDHVEFMKHTQVVYIRLYGSLYNVQCVIK